MANHKRKRIVSAFCAVAMLFSATGNWLLPLQGIAEDMTETGSTETAAETEAATDPDKDLCCQSFALHPNGENADQTVSLEGLMPEGASAEAVDVSDNYPGVVAYDITITNGNDEFQPVAEAPIFVEIADPGISDEDRIEVWHILDSGEHEVITDFALEDGKISFYAAGFSVYAVVAEADVISEYDPVNDYHSIRSIDELANYGEDSDGLYIDQKDGYYLTKNVMQNSDTDTKTGIQKTKVGTNKGSDLKKAIELGAVPYYFEKVSGKSNQFYVFCYEDNANKTGKLYVTENEKGLDLTSIADAKVAFTVSGSNGNYKLRNASTKNYWYMVGNYAGNIIGTHTGGSDFKMWYHIDDKDDTYHLDGVEHGLMHYIGGTACDALMAKNDANAQEMMCVYARLASGNTTLYVTENVDIDVWKFHSIERDQYKISSTVGGETKYLKADGNSLVLVDEAAATSFKVVPGTNNTIKLTADDKTVYYDGDTKSFRLGTPPTPASQWLTFAEQSELLPADYVTYSAEKVSISSVQNEEAVIVYTRVWNETKKAYEFYAVDHDGTLYPCYERGDDIMWMGREINTLLWQFTEHTYDDGTANRYYDLYNLYSKKYIAPQIKINQVLSDDPIGLNMPGRRNGEFYSTFLAWDNPQYAFASLKVEDGKVVPAYRSEAQTFYFAKVDTAVSTLTKVETIDNSLYGIKMKMVDFPDRAYQLSYIGSDNYDNTIQQGLLTTDLDENGYPVAVNGDKHSLSELFADAKNVNHLFIKSTYEASGYFEFDSCQNFATLLDSNNDGNFTVYKELGTSDKIDRSTLKHGQFLPYNTIKPGEFATVNNPLNLYSALAIYNDNSAGKLPEEDPRKYEKLYTVGPNPNYYNGMEVSAKFVQTWNGCDEWGHDMIFEFTGDDDFWLYVDGELVIDLGGVHSALAGKINFRTGEVFVNGETSNLRDVFKSNYMDRHRDATETEIHDFLAQYFDEVDGQFATVFKPYSAHTMRIFYMERGASASNLHMRFNLSYASEDHVILTKQVTGTENIDFDRVEYPYQIYYRTDENDPVGLLMSPKTDDGEVLYQNSIQKVTFSESHTPLGSDKEFKDVYYIAPKKRVELHFPPSAKQYRIVECGVDSEVYDVVKVNDHEITGKEIENSTHKTYDSGWLDVNEVRNITYDNHVKDGGLLSLRIQKLLYDEKHDLVPDRTKDPTVFNFRLYLSNGVSDNLEEVAIGNYHVRDEHNHLCWWDSDLETFVPSDKTSLDGMTDAEKDRFTFPTSEHGSISMIPVNYIVEVPNLPVGTKFKVVETGIPVGYKLIGYEREGGSYIEDGSANCGWIKPDVHADMKVKNQRGCEIEVNKIWTDEKYMEVYDTIYTAIYLDGELLKDTVRPLEYPEVTVRYYFDALEPGKTLDDYQVYEVVPTVGEDGVTTYTKVEDDDQTKVMARSKYTTTPIGLSEYTYNVTYDRGIAHTSTDTLSGKSNIRIDTITNTRTDGIVLTLYDMHTGLPLANGEFVLTKGEETIDTYISDSTGRIVLLYDFERNVDYTLTETAPPSGYIGLPHPSVFNIKNDNSITITGNEDPTLPNGKVWEKAYKSSNPGDAIVAYVDVFNKKYDLSAIKVDMENDAKKLSGAHFALYRQADSIGGLVKDPTPIQGYADLETNNKGVIPGIDNTLAPGTYFLTEIQAPKRYELLDDDVIFNISSTGGVTLIAAPEGTTLNTTTGDMNTYELVVRDKKDGEHIVLTGLTGTQSTALLLIVLPLLPIGLILFSRKKRKHADESDAA